MRSALLLASLFLTAGLAVATVPAASACGGVVDVDCDTTYCTQIDDFECSGHAPAHCLVYVDYTFATGHPENYYTLACSLVLFAGASAASDSCGGVVDVDCDGQYCDAYYTGPFPPECLSYQDAYCAVYVQDPRDLFIPVCANISEG